MILDAVSVQAVARRTVLMATSETSVSRLAAGLRPAVGSAFGGVGAMGGGVGGQAYPRTYGPHAAASGAKRYGLRNSQ
jgi:hypothetical protein